MVKSTSAGRIAQPRPHAHPIQVVTRRTGLSADVIRAWEKRYEVVSPMRSAAGRRLYTDADIERLRSLARATLTGRTIGQVASLSVEAIEALLQAEAPSLPALATPESAANSSEHLRRATHAQETPSPAIDHLTASLEAVERCDGPALAGLLRRASVALSAETLLDGVVVPLWRLVGERVHDGTLSPAHGHLTLAVLRRVLDRMTEDATTLAPRPALLVATPSGLPQGAQELGALLMTATAAAEGWRATYVGQGLSAEDIADTADRLGAVAVGLSLGTVPGDRVIPRELRRLRALLPAWVTLLIEGAAVDAYRAVIREVGGFALHDLSALRARLRAERASSPA